LFEILPNYIVNGKTFPLASSFSSFFRRFYSKLNYSSISSNVESVSFAEEAVSVEFESVVKLSSKAVVSV